MKRAILIFPPKKGVEGALTLPSLGWLSLFFTIPILIVLILSFNTPPTENGISSFSFQSFRVLCEKSTLIITWRTIWLSSSATIISILLSLPIAYSLARMKKRLAQTLLLLIFIPSWSCFLVRIFAWKTLLHPDGFVEHCFVTLGLCSKNESLLYNNFAVLFAMVYSYAPFALLPLYNAACKFNFQLFDAAYDLGATHALAMRKIFLPNIMPACRTAALLVLIPAAGAYIIPDLVGGTDGSMLGNKIAQKIFFERNIPEACVLSLLLASVIFILSKAISRTASTARNPSSNIRINEKGAP